LRDSRRKEAESWANLCSFCARAGFAVVQHTCWLQFEHYRQTILQLFSWIWNNSRKIVDNDYLYAAELEEVQKRKWAVKVKRARVRQGNCKFCSWIRKGWSHTIFQNFLNTSSYWGKPRLCSCLPFYIKLCLVWGGINEAICMWKKRYLLNVEDDTQEFWSARDGESCNSEQDQNEIWRKRHLNKRSWVRRNCILTRLMVGMLEVLDHLFTSAISKGSMYPSWVRGECSSISELW